MPIYHATLFFSTQQHGWVEQFYRIDSALDEALEAAQVLALDRYQILGAGALVYKVRVGVVGAPRATATRMITGQTLAVPAMDAHIGAEIRLQAAGSFRCFRSYFLRGLPREGIVNPAGPSRWHPSIWNAAMLWLLRLSDGKWAMRARSLVGRPATLIGLLPVSIQNGGEDPAQFGPPMPSGWPVAVWGWTDQDIGWPDLAGAVAGPPEVRISRVRWSDPSAAKRSGVNGEFPVMNSFANSLYYLGPLPATGSYSGGGTVQIVTHTYLPIGTARLTRGGHRKAGPPTAVPGLVAAAPAGPGTRGSLPTVPRLPLVSLPDLAGQLGQTVPPFTPTGPLVGPVQPPPYPPPISGTLRTARDVLVYIATNLTFSGLGVEYQPLGIAKILNMENTWWVGAAGLYPEGGSSTGKMSAINNAFAGNNQYVIFTRAIIKNNIPDDADLILQGYSLGGMMLENVCAGTQTFPRVKQLTTFGSPITGIGWARAPIVRFAVVNDFVPRMSPAGWFNTLLKDPFYEIIGEQSPHGWFPANHDRMFENTYLDRYDNWGYAPAGRPEFVLGRLSRFRPEIEP